MMDAVRSIMTESKAAVTVGVRTHQRERKKLDPDIDQETAMTEVRHETIPLCFR